MVERKKSPADQASFDLQRKLTGEWAEKTPFYSYPKTMQAFLAWTSGFIADFAITGNSDGFIKQWNVWQSIMTDCIQAEASKHVFISEEQMRASFVYFDIKGNDVSTPEEWARDIWRHERAHQQVAEKWRIESAIGLSLPEFGNLVYPVPYIGFDMRAFRRLAARNQLQQAVGEILIAPHLAGCGYEKETHDAQILLAAAQRNHHQRY